MLREIKELEIRIVRKQQDLAREYRLRDAAETSEEQYQYDGTIEHIRYNISEMKDDLAEMIREYEATSGFTRDPQ